MAENEFKWCFGIVNKEVYSFESLNFKIVNFDIETYDASN